MGCVVSALLSKLLLKGGDGSRAGQGTSSIGASDSQQTPSRVMTSAIEMTATVRVRDGVKAHEQWLAS